MESSGSQPRGRLLIALAAALALGTLVIVVVVAGGEDDPRSLAPAAPACISAWNDDPAATAYGRHNFNFHQYDGALVTFLTAKAEEVEEGEGGDCAVIFPSRVLDPEPFAAGEVRRGKRWLPISELAGIDLARVGELQVAAAAAPNTTLDTTGRLTAR